MITEKIVDIEFKNTEQLSESMTDRKSIYDIYCNNQKGERFIVEVQKAKQNYFKERTIYYSTFPIRDQAEKGKWDFNLQAVYCVGILDFVFDDNDKKEVMHTIKLKNQNGEVFYDKLTYIYLEMPNFNKAESELKTQLDKWLYFIKHLEDLQNIPQIFDKEKIFTEAFNKAALANLSQEDYMQYEFSLKSYRDYHNTIEYAFDEGKIEGKIEVAKSLKESNVSIEIIMKTTGLSKKEIEKL